MKGSAPHASLLQTGDQRRNRRGCWKDTTTQASLLVETDWRPGRGFQLAFLLSPYFYPEQKLVCGPGQVGWTFPGSPDGRERKQHQPPWREKHKKGLHIPRGLVSYLTNEMNQEPADCFCEGPDGTYFRLRAGRPLLHVLSSIAAARELPSVNRDA